jgi:hypothetical protein
MIRTFLAVFFAVSLLLGISYQLHLQREAELKREVERRHFEALKQYDRDINSFKQLGRMFQP